jgi:hypothetical protein
MVFGTGAILLAYLTVQRLIELWWARENEARLMASGGIEYGLSHLTLMILFHAAWMAGLWLLASGHSKTAATPQRKRGRSTPNNGHERDQSARPFRANSRHSLTRERALAFAWRGVKTEGPMAPLACKLPPLHDTPPAPSKHLTRCLWNRVQAKRSH